ncbi:hypothetical protein AB1K83_15800 [Sporosarcina sp. 179-K 3D1 HS]|uniref:hypothetical protein n=1 Tax=Sporosarcina sp. 179-K 3D1 HS TaxID=3232169 RepID=UPI0039A35113
MQKKWRKTGAAILIAGLTVTGTGYALATEKAEEPIDLDQLNADPEAVVIEMPPVTVGTSDKEEVVLDEEIVTDEEDTNGEEGTDKDEVSKEDEVTENESDLPEIPEGYTAGNLAALAKAYENVQNPTAKESIKRNMERSIAKWESKQPVTETPEQPESEEKEQPKKETPEQPVVKEPVKEEKPVKAKPAKSPQAELNAKHKEEKEELKAAQKAEREALKAERKAEKEKQKQEKKENKQ